MIDFDKVLAYAMDNSSIYESHCHGVDHWTKVAEHAVNFASETKGADITVAHLFGLLHDFKRSDDEQCFKHGVDSAKAIYKIRKTLLKKLSKKQFNTLVEAIKYHPDGKVSDDPTIGCCWDADRVELPRVGIDVSLEYITPLKI